MVYLVSICIRSTYSFYPGWHSGLADSVVLAYVSPSHPSNPDVINHYITLGDGETKLPLIPATLNSDQLINPTNILYACDPHG